MGEVDVENIFSAYEKLDVGLKRTDLLIQKLSKPKTDEVLSLSLTIVVRLKRLLGDIVRLEDPEYPEEYLRKRLFNLKASFSDNVPELYAEFREIVERVKGFENATFGKYQSSQFSNQYADLSRDIYYFGEKLSDRDKSKIVKVLETLQQRVEIKNEKFCQSSDY